MKKRDFPKVNKTGEEGYILVVTAILLIVLIGFVAMGTDSGILYSGRTMAQEAVDAAALSGASSFLFDPSGPQPDTAEDYALNTALEQGVLADAVAAGEVTINVDIPNRRVTVQWDRVEGTYLARALGIDSAPIRVDATAEASQVPTGASCVKPWFLPNSITLPTGSTVCDACDPTNPEYNQLLIQNGMVTAWAESFIDSGQQIKIKPGNPQNALEPGQFYAIRLPGNSGAQDYREGIETCVSNAYIFCAECYGSEPGNMIGPTKQGTEGLIGNPADVFVSSGVYCNGGDCRDTSPSLITVPVWDVCYAPGEGCAATTFCPGGNLSDMGANVEVKVIGFAMLFIDGMQGNDVLARIINVVVCQGAPDVTDDGVQPAPFAIPVRLVTVPEA